MALLPAMPARRVVLRSLARVMQPPGAAFDTERAEDRRPHSHDPQSRLTSLRGTRVATDHPRRHGACLPAFVSEFRCHRTALVSSALRASSFRVHVSKLYTELYLVLVAGVAAGPVPCAAQHQPVHAQWLLADLNQPSSLLYFSTKYFVTVAEPLCRYAAMPRGAYAKLHTRFL